MSRYGVSRYGSLRYSRSSTLTSDEYIPSVDNTSIINLVPIVSTLEVVPDIEKVENLKPSIVEAEED